MEREGDEKVGEDEEEIRGGDENWEGEKGELGV